MKERLAVSLTLKLGGTDHVIPGGAVRALSLTMHPWGVEGSVEIVAQDDSGQSGKYKDAIFADFQKPDLGEVTIAVEPGHLETDTKAAGASVKTYGIVLERQLREVITHDGEGAAGVIARYYHVRFADPASALWQQHFPTELYTSKSFKDVIEAHKGDKITLSYDLDAVTTAAPQIFFHLDPGARASFYDLVLWYLAGVDGVFTFDHAVKTYSIKKAKDASGTAAEVQVDDIASLTSIFPEIPRYKPRVLSSYTEATRSEPCDNANAAAGVFHDILMRTPIAADVDARVTAEKARPLLPGREVEVTFRRFPTVATSPGSLLSISAKGGNSSALYLAQDPWRVYRLTLEARALDEGSEADYGGPATSFEVSVSARLEAKTEPALRMPPFAAPRYPGYLEGKVVSTVGADEDITYLINTDSDTSLERYTIKIPLFANQEIVAPYEPSMGAGTLYLPQYKNERVLVALDFSSARVAALLDWRAEAKVAADGQGQHLFLGKSAKSSTSVLHDYQDEKPVLSILRTNDKDTVLFKLEEGKLTLKVEEKQGS